MAFLNITSVFQNHQSAMVHSKCKIQIYLFQNGVWLNDEITRNKQTTRLLQSLEKCWCWFREPCKDAGRKMETQITFNWTLQTHLLNCTGNEKHLAAKYKTHTLKTMWYISSEANKKHRISTFAEFIRQIKQSEETNAQRDFFGNSCWWEELTLPVVEANTSLKPAHLLWPKNKYAASTTNWPSRTKWGWEQWSILT